MKKLLIILTISLIIVSCKTKRKDQLPNITGKAGEVILVINNQLWKSETGLLLDTIFKQNQIALPQPEPILDLIRIPEEAFTSLFEHHRNVILVNHKKSETQSKLEIKKNVWANNQIVISITASSKETLNEIIKNNSQKITNSILDIEQERIIENYSKYKEPRLIDFFQKKFNIGLTIPKGYTLGTDTIDFAWISHETPLISQGIFVYTYDYVDTNAFAKENLIAKRNEILKKYVFGPAKNSYMTTEIEADVYFNEFIKDKNYVAKLSGLWKLVGDFMGGPFISYSTLNKNKSKIITVEGYVYAPKFDKRNYLRQVEAIVHSIKIK